MSTKRHCDLFLKFLENEFLNQCGGLGTGLGFWSGSGLGPGSGSLQLTVATVRRNASVGRVCWSDSADIVDGAHTGVVRVRHFSTSFVLARY